METNSIIILAGRKYDGYLWYSDEQQPRIYREKELGAEICSSDTPSIPFIIEGYLRSGNDSYSIKMTFVELLHSDPKAGPAGESRYR